MTLLSSFLTAAGLGLGAGVNAYATVLVFGLLARFLPGSVPGQYAHVFALTPVIVTAAVLYTIEFVADKVPGVDHVWDVIHSFIRPVAGAALGVAAVAPQMPKSAMVIASLIAGGAALTAHVGKATTRLASTATTAGVGNPILSVVEDVLAVGQALIAVFLPYLVLAMLAILLLVFGFAMIRRSEQRSA
ncbi:MAG: DUF4126 domain-containing protein [Acidobacteriota bacterium]